jgi:hypothetical protein
MVTHNNAHVFSNSAGEGTSTAPALSGYIAQAASSATGTYSLRHRRRRQKNAAQGARLDAGRLDVVGVGAALP